MEIKSTNLSNEEIKKIVHSIVKDESLKYGVDINVEIISKHNFFKKNFTKTPFSLTKNVLAFYSKGLYFSSTENNKNYILVFFNENNFFFQQNKEHQLSELIRTTYHEIRHFLQHNIPSIFNNFEAFIFAYENSYILDIGEDDYNANHDYFYIEIDAQLYAIKNVLNYLKDYPNLYEKNSKYLLNLLKDFEIQKNNFNFNYIFKKICKDLKNRPGFYSYDSSLFLQFFWNKDGSFKTVDEIINSPFYTLIGDETVFSVFSSEAYLKNIHHQIRSVDDDETLYKALNFYYENILHRKKINKLFFQNKDICRSQFTEFEFFFNEELFRIKKEFNLLFKEKYDFENVNMSDNDCLLPIINFSHYTR